MAKKQETKAPVAVKKEVRKPVERSEKRAVVKKPNWLQARYRETVGELRKVSWPTREEALNLTWIVLGVMVFVGLFLGVTDWILQAVLRVVLGA